MNVVPQTPALAGRKISTVWAAVAAAAAISVGSASALDPRLGIAVALMMGVIVLAVLRPGSILVVLVASVFLEATALGGITISRLIAPIALFVVTVELLRGASTLRPAAPLGFATAYAAWAIGSGFWTVSTSATLLTLGSLAIALVYMLCFAVFVESERDVRVVLHVLALASLVIGLASLVTFAGYAIPGQQSGRVQGGVGDPNFFAHLQLVAFPVVLVLAAAAERRWLRWGLAAAALVVPASILSTLSRGGLIALTLLVLVILFAPARALFTSRRQKSLILLVLAFGMIILFARPGFRAEVVGRASTIFTGGSQSGSTAGSGRTGLWQAAWATIEDRPLHGLGFGGFRVSSNELLMTTPGVDLELISPHPQGLEAHSAYLGTAADLGLPGLALFLAVLVATGVSLRHTARRARRARALFLSRIANALLLSLVGWAASSLFIETQTSRPLWVVVGLSLALAKVVARRAAQAPEPGL